MNTDKRPSAMVTGPFDSLRDYVEALERNGHLLRIREMNQDAYESTGFAYRLMDRIGFNYAPAFLLESVVMQGRRYRTPVLGNLYGPLICEAMGLGVEPLSDDQDAMYEAAIRAIMDKGGPRGWQPIPPRQVEAAAAPAKAVIKRGEQIDLFDYPWIQNNPADAGRYISMGSLITEDPELGRNVGTYRFQVKSARRLGVNPELGQHGWNYLMALKRRGLKPAAIGVYPRNTTAVKTALLDLRRQKPGAVILVGAYRPVAALIAWSRHVGFNPVFVTISFVGSNALLRELGPAGVGVFVTQVVPFPTAKDLPIAAAYRRDLAAHAPDALPGFVSFEGYLAGRLAIRALELCGRELERACLLDRLRRAADIDLGGFRLHFGKEGSQGSDAVFLTVIGAGGRYYPAKTMRLSSGT